MPLTRAQKWERYLEAAEEIHACVDGLKFRNLAQKPDTADRFSGIIAEWIFRLPRIHSGLISVEGSKQKTPTCDHYFGRKSSGVLIYNQILAGQSVHRIAAILASRARVHRVSERENTALKKIDSKQLLKSKTRVMQEYAEAGIELIPFTRRREQKYVYIINGIEYNDIMDAAAATGCSHQTVKNRCVKDKRGKYPTWIRKNV